MTVAVELHEGFCFVEVTVRVQGGADITQLQHQCGENPVARLQPTTGVISHIYKEGTWRRHIYHGVSFQESVLRDLHTDKAMEVTNYTENKSAATKNNKTQTITTKTLLGSILKPENSVIIVYYV